MKLYSAASGAGAFPAVVAAAAFGGDAVGGGAAVPAGHDVPAGGGVVVGERLTAGAAVSGPGEGGSAGVVVFGAEPSSLAPAAVEFFRAGAAGAAGRLAVGQPITIEAGA